MDFLLLVYPECYTVVMQLLEYRQFNCMGQNRFVCFINAYCVFDFSSTKVNWHAPWDKYEWQHVQASPGISLAVHCLEQTVHLGWFEDLICLGSAGCNGAMLMLCFIEQWVNAIRPCLVHKAVKGSSHNNWAASVRLRGLRNTQNHSLTDEPHPQPLRPSALASHCFKLSWCSAKHQWLHWKTTTSVWMCLLSLEYCFFFSQVLFSLTVIVFSTALKRLQKIRVVECCERLCGIVFSVLFSEEQGSQAFIPNNSGSVTFECHYKRLAVRKHDIWHWMNNIAAQSHLSL